jgi:hypothetical protein
LTVEDSALSSTVDVQIYKKELASWYWASGEHDYQDEYDMTIFLFPLSTDYPGAPYCTLGRLTLVSVAINHLPP